MNGGTQDGFSLVEMLVVIAVVSVLAVGASLPLSRSVPTAASEGNELAAAVSRLRSLAILSDAPYALSIDGSGWRAERVVPGAAPLKMAGHEGRLRSRLAVLDSGGEVSDRARVVILPDGTGTPVRFRLDGADGPVICASPGDGVLSCTPV